MSLSTTHSEEAKMVYEQAAFGGAIRKIVCCDMDGRWFLNSHCITVPATVRQARYQCQLPFVLFLL